MTTHINPQTIKLINMKGIISVETSIGTVFKFGFDSETLVKEIVQSATQKCHIKDGSCFGLMPFREEDYKPNERERVFLKDECSLESQNIKNGDKLYLGVKYPYDELQEEVKIDIIFAEMKKRYLLYSLPDPLSVETVVSLTAFLIKEAKISAKKITNETLKQYAPQHPSLIGKEAEIIKSVGQRMKQIKSKTFQEGAKSFLTTLALSMGQIFNAYFLAVHAESSACFWISADKNGVSFIRTQADGHDEVFQFVPYIQCASWHATISLTASKNTDTSDGLSAREKKRMSRTRGNSKSWRTKRSSNTAHNSLFKEVYDDSTVYKSIFGFDLKNSSAKAFTFTLFSRFRNAERLVEYFEKHYREIEESIEEDSMNAIIDDPFESADIVTCTAVQDNVARNPDELFFCKGDTITIIEKRGNDEYLGECSGIQGIFKKSKVKFRTQIADSVDILAKAGVKVSDGGGFTTSQKGTEIIPTYLLDGTKLTLIVSVKTTVKMLKDMIVEKIDLSDSDFFEIAEERNGIERWLDPKLSVFHQLTHQRGCRLVFKARCFFKDIGEITDPQAIHLLFLQISKQIIESEISISEAEAIELASYHFQAVLGDHDPEVHKTGYFESLKDFLPASIIKSKSNESNLQKKIFAAHSQIVGIPKLDSEKYYITLVEKKSTYGRMKFSSMVKIFKFRRMRSSKSVATEFI